jgi:hypothetical protein
MMQPCASAAKLRGGGPSLNSGMQSHGISRVTTTSVIRQFVCETGEAPKLFALATSLISSVWHRV